MLAVMLSLMLPCSAVSGQVGAHAPAFSLRDANGATVALDRFQGRVVLLEFWASWCASCREVLPELERLYVKFRDKGFIVIGINVDGSQAGAEGFLKKLGATFPVLLDETGDAADAYRVSGLPAGFLIGRDGVILRTYRGFERAMIPLMEKHVSDQLEN